MGKLLYCKRCEYETPHLPRRNYGGWECFNCGRIQLWLKDQPKRETEPGKAVS